MKALIVDDQLSSRKILRYYLEAQGGTVLEAANGAEALELAGREPLDIIISDAQMPVMDGFQLLREIRLRPDLAATPFIFYSAVYTGADDRALALSLGADAVIAKPKDPEEFWAELKSSLRLSKESKRKACEKVLLEEDLFLRKYSAIVAETLDETVQSEALFMATFEQAAVGMAHVALDGHWLDFNSKLCELTGYSKAEISQLTLQKITHPEDCDIDEDEVRRLLASEISNYNREKRMIRKDGQLIWINLSVSLLRTPAGTPRCFISVIEEITRRKEAEEGVRASRSNYLNLLHAIVDGMIITDGQGVVTLLNRAAAALPCLLWKTTLGRPVEETVADLGLATHIRDCLGGGEAGVKREVQLFDPARNEDRDFQAITSVTRNDEEEATGSITLLREVTAERESSRLKSEFIATAAHELRTPLTAVMGYVDLLQEMGDGDEALRHEGLATIAEKSKVLEKIVDDLYDLSRVEAGRSLPLDRVECDLGALLSRIVGEYRQEVGSRKFDLVLTGSPLSLSADVMKIGQVLENLINNAIKFSSEESLIRIGCEGLGAEVQVSVRDEGIGMTTEQVGHAFEKFYRADASNTAKKGLGLGLAIARNIIEAHGGRIWLSSDPEQGTEVRFSLPVALLP